MASITPYGARTPAAATGVISSLEGLAKRMKYPSAEGVAELLRYGLLPISYYIERREAGKLVKVLPLPNQPSDVTIQKQFVENPIYTFSDDYSLRQIAPPRQATVTISGFTGSSPRLHVNSDGQLEFADPVKHLKEFDRFINEYFRDAATSKLPVTYTTSRLQNDLNYKTRPYLVFRALDEEVHGRCVIETFSYIRTAGGSRMGYQWSLQLRIYDSAEAGLINPVDAFFDGIDDVINAVNTYLAAATAFVGIGQNALNRASSTFNTAEDFRRQLGNVFQGVGSLIQGFGQFSRDFFSVFDGWDATLSNSFRAFRTLPAAGEHKEWWGVQAFATSRIENHRAEVMPPYQGIRERNAAERRRRADERSAADLAERAAALTVAEEDFIYLLLDISHMLQVGRGYFGTAYNEAKDSHYDDHSFDGRYLTHDHNFKALSMLSGNTSMFNTPDREAYRLYTMRAGDSLASIALAIYGNANDWSTLAEFNGCQDGRTMADGSPIQAGTQIKVPVEQAALLPLTSSGGDNSLEEMVGTDIRLTFDGDMIFRNADMEMLSGEENMQQWVTSTLRTVIGDNYYFASIGLDYPIIGMKMTDEAIAMAIANMREALTVDPRITNVKDIQLLRDGDTLNVRLAVDCVDDISFDFTIPIPEEEA